MIETHDILALLITVGILGILAFILGYGSWGHNYDPKYDNKSLNEIRDMLNLEQEVKRDRILKGLKK